VDVIDEIIEGLPIELAAPPAPIVIGILNGPYPVNVNFVPPGNEVLKPPAPPPAPLSGCPPPPPPATTK
jgi:hypothetical protein